MAYWGNPETRWCWKQVRKHKNGSIVLRTKLNTTFKRSEQELRDAGYRAYVRKPAYFDSRPL